MAETGIDLGVHLIAKSGEDRLDAVIEAPEIHFKPGTRTPFRVCFAGDQHILTIGPTRSGKGRKLLCPQLATDLDRSMVVIDPKGELAKWTALHRANGGGDPRLKNDVFALDPFGVLSNMPGVQLPSIGYNPMRWIDPKSDDFVDDAAAIAEAICPVESEKDPHWEQGAQDIVAGLIMYRAIVSSGGSLADIRRDLSRGEKQWADLFWGADGQGGPTKEGHPSLLQLVDKHPALLARLGAFRDYKADDRGLNSFLQVAKTNTAWLDSPPVARDLTRPGMDFRTLKEKPVTVYLVLPPKRLVTHAKWLRLVLAGAIEALRKTTAHKKRPPTLFILDEFPQLGRMQEVETGVALNAGYGIKFWIVIQSITQLKSLYKENWEAFTAGGALTAFAPRDPTTSEYLSKMAGDIGIEMRSTSIGGDGGKSVSRSVERREAIMPHQFRQMRDGMLFAFLPGKDGAKMFITETWDFTDERHTGVPDAVKARDKLAI
jgi:type IV secretion system protein VirD4